MHKLFNLKYWYNNRELDTGVNKLVKIKTNKNQWNKNRDFLLFNLRSYFNGDLGNGVW